MSIMPFLFSSVFLAPGDPFDERVLIKRLGSESFTVRERAAAELIAIGPRALPPLRQALTTVDLETKRRVESCIQVIETEPSYADLRDAYCRQIGYTERLVCCRGHCIYRDMKASADAHSASIPGLEQKLRLRGVGDAQLQAMKAEVVERHNRRKGQPNRLD